MDRDLGPTLSLSFDPDVLGQAQAWTVDHRSQEYRGEVIVSEAVDPAFGQPLGQDAYFRVVFFTVPRRIPAGRIHDPRVAMAVPQRSLKEAWETIGRELRPIHEAKAKYISSRDQEVPALRRSMDERESSIRGELARRYRTSFSLGRIYTHPDISIRSRDIFTEEDPESWTDNLASAVLSQNYPSIPFNYENLPFAVTNDVILAVFRLLFQADGDTTGVGRTAASALGLARSESPAVFDGGEMPAPAMLRILTDRFGLTRPLATLFLLGFVRKADAEISLAPGHAVESRRGGPFLSDHITSDLIAEISFPHMLDEPLGTLRIQSALTSDTILPYATLLVEGLGSGDGATFAAGEERRLLERLSAIGREVLQVIEALNVMEAALGAGPSDSRDVLAGLQALCAVSSHREFYSVARESFYSPSGLSDALEHFGRLGKLAEIAPVIAGIKRYLDRMTFGPQHGDLLFERDTLAARIEPNSLAENPSLWSSIEEEFQRLRDRYANAYVAHHGRYYQEALELNNRLASLKPKVDALTRFIQIEELGEPLGTDVPQRFKDVSASVRVCSTQASDLTLEDAPDCPGCGLPLDSQVPRSQVELLGGAIEGAMREYNRRLGSQGVRQVLVHPTREQLDKFVNLVQVADPSALANVLDDRVVEFLRQFLRDR